MYRLPGLAILAFLASIALAATPASATGGGGGVVEGTVNIPAGIPTGACAPTSYTFASTALVGAFADTFAGAYAGGLVVNANGGSPCENTQGGSGTVNVTCGSAPPQSGPSRAIWRAYSRALVRSSSSCRQ
jgi:hypothetical protein